MKQAKPTRRPHLFVLRVWLVESGDGQQAWRGEIQHIASREKRYFREWSVLLDFVQAQVRAACTDDFRSQQEEKPQF